jgi:hypothetical protein
LEEQLAPQVAQTPIGKLHILTTPAAISREQEWRFSSGRKSVKKLTQNLHGSKAVRPEPGAEIPKGTGCAALDQRQIELMLQLPHRFRDGRLASEERGSSARKAAMFVLSP